MTKATHSAGVGSSNVVVLIECMDLQMFFFGSWTHSHSLPLIFPLFHLKLNGEPLAAFRFDFHPRPNGLQVAKVLFCFCSDNIFQSLSMGNGNKNVIDKDRESLVKNK
jgi:hypothetical protein